MLNKKRPLSLDTLKLSNPQRIVVGKLLARQKNKYKRLLHEAHERMHIISETAASLEFWYNVNGSYEYVSATCEQVLGYPREAFLNNGLFLEDVVHPDDQERFRQDMQRALQGESDRDVEYAFLDKDGTPKWLQTTWSPVTTRRGNHIGIRMSLRDITLFKQCQSFSQAYRRLMLEVSNELTDLAVFSLSPEGEILSWNNCAEKLFGYTKEEIIGKDFIILFGGDIDLEAELPDFGLLVCDTKIMKRLTFQSNNGSDFVKEITFIPLCDHAGTMHLVTCLLRLPSE